MFEVTNHTEAVVFGVIAGVVLALISLSAASCLVWLVCWLFTPKKGSALFEKLKEAVKSKSFRCIHSKADNHRIDFMSFDSNIYLKAIVGTKIAWDYYITHPKSKDKNLFDFLPEREKVLFSEFAGPILVKLYHKRVDELEKIKNEELLRVGEEFVKTMN